MYTKNRHRYFVFMVIRRKKNKFADFYSLFFHFIIIRSFRTVESIKHLAMKGKITLKSFRYAIAFSNSIQCVQINKMRTSWSCDNTGFIHPSVSVLFLLVNKNYSRGFASEMQLNLLCKKMLSDTLWPIF